VQTLIRSGRLKPIDKTRLPNLKNIDPAYLDLSFDPGNHFSVPYAFGTTIIGYNDEKLKDLGLPTDTWALIFDPKHLKKIKGRVTVLDSATSSSPRRSSTWATRPMPSIPSIGTKPPPSSGRQSPTGPHSTRPRTSRS
jgi:ABC-type glycerol-3-phosphate transport system substrate-binding protein